MSHYTVHFVLLLGDGCISRFTIIITYCMLRHHITGDIHTDKCTDMSHYYWIKALKYSDKGNNIQSDNIVSQGHNRCINCATV